MKKEILITILCAGLMLVTPFTTIAQENKSTSNLVEESVVENDCNFCLKASKSQFIRLKSISERLERLNNKLLELAKLNLEVEEKYQELSDKINEFLVAYNNVKNNIPKDRIKPICVYLLIRLGINLLGSIILDEIHNIFELLPFSILLFFYHPIYSYLDEIMDKIGSNIYDIAWALDCNWAVIPPPIY